jgi:hypothetical protein
MREFSHQVYGNNSREDIIAAQQAKIEAQNALAQSGGKSQSGGESVNVVQFDSAGSGAGPTSTNDNIKSLSSTLLRSDEIAKVQGNTGLPKGGSRRRSRKRNRNRNSRKRNRKSRKY